MTVKIGKHELPYKEGVAVAEALRMPGIDPLDYHSREKILKEFANGADPCARWSERRLGRLLDDYYRVVRLEVIKKVRKEIGFKNDEEETR